MRQIKAAAVGTAEASRMEQAAFRPVVCVVDADGAVRRALAFALELEGFAVETYPSGEALLGDLPTTAACLVLDERLPGVSGIDTLRQLRARAVRLPAILTATHPGPALRAIAARAGMPILEKPLLGETLAAAIHGLLATSGV